MQGSCKCGAVAFTSGEPLQVVNCHCSLCRSINGSAFSSYAVVRAATFSIDATESPGAFVVVDRTTKHFCKACGTPVYNTNPRSYPGLTMVYLGAIKDHHGLRAGINIYCSTKLDWVDAVSSLPSFPEAPMKGDAPGQPQRMKDGGA